TRIGPHARKLGWRRDDVDQSISELAVIPLELLLRLPPCFVSGTIALLRSVGGLAENGRADQADFAGLEIGKADRRSAFWVAGSLLRGGPGNVAPAQGV